jgi:hypothetical protein
MNPTKNLIELKLLMNPTKNLIEPKLLMNYFTLYEVGSFNSDSGMFESLSDIRLVIKGSSLKPDVS